MAQRIHPQEFHLLQDNPYIRTKCPQDQITEADILSRVKNGNLAAGDFILVQCMNSDYTELLSWSEWVIKARKTALVTYEMNDRDTRQVEEITYRVRQATPWKTGDEGFETDQGEENVFVDERIGIGQKPVPMLRKWNPAKQRHEVLLGDTVVAFHINQDTAQRMADGELPLSEAV